MSRTRRLLLVYGLLLVASHLVIGLGGGEAGTPGVELPEGMRRARVVADHGAAGSRERASDAAAPDESPTGRSPAATLAYRALGEPGPEAILLLHGSPGSLQDFASLADRVGVGRFVLVPDMLGFGHSTRSVPDHSFVAQADALVELLDQLGVERAHVVGFSWGGGVALEIAARRPERVASVVMVSAIGVQELELLGRFELNRLVHAFQHTLLVALDWLVPHFGGLSGSPLGRGYTRSFLDSDQRPMREILSGWAGPMLIIHGTQDLLVPAAAAREHHRLVPQSEIEWIEGGHLVLWDRPEDVARALRAWFERSDSGSLRGRGRAEAERLRLAALPFDDSQAGPQDGIGWIVFGLLVFAASMVSEDLTCAGVGLLVATGQVGFIGGVLACILALVLGDLVLYATGRAMGAPVLRRLGREPGEIGSVGEKLERSGGVAVLLGRFVPGARLPTYVAAGVIGVPLLRFTGWLIGAALLWAPFLVGLSALGGRALDMQGASPRQAFWTGIVLILVIAVAARLAPRLVTWRGRRLALSSWRRLMRWEFWPIWAIYGPLVPSFLAMMIRHRSVRAPTLVNPAIPGGGLAGESKAALGETLAQVPEHDIATVVIPPGPIAARVALVEDFLASPGERFPLVMKPDVGERGRGVEILEDLAAARAYLETHDALTLVQRFVSGQEFGVFYVRRPGAATGELFSIGRKTPRHVTGNGVDSIERLVLVDPVCSPMAERLLEQNVGRLDQVPAAGERVRVARIGTHSLGCRFFVGEDLRTPALEEAFDRLSRRLGLDFGRYDVLSPDEASFRAGHFRVVEFNGLTGEAAHMYDPRYGLREGLRILHEQWTIAFEIGAAHRATGREPLSFAALARLVTDSRR